MGVRCTARSGAQVVKNVKFSIEHVDQPEIADNVTNNFGTSACRELLTDMLQEKKICVTIHSTIIHSLWCFEGRMKVTH